MGISHLVKSDEAAMLKHMQEKYDPYIYMAVYYSELVKQYDGTIETVNNQDFYCLQHNAHDLIIVQFCKLDNAV